jgi:hypothetical protein
VELECSPIAGQIEQVPADILQARERRLELGSDRVRMVGSESRDEPVFVAMPLAVDRNRVIEFGRTNFRQVSRLTVNTALNPMRVVLITE